MERDYYKELPPPRKEDVLFCSEQADVHNNACLNWAGSGSDDLSTEGYLWGARYLVERVLDTASDQDSLIYPIIFLYRHQVELALRRIILRVPFVIHRDLTEAEKRHLGKHRLDLLWQDLKPMLSAVCRAARWTEPDPQDIEGIDSHIRQLSKRDPDSFSFRYSHSKTREPSLPTDLKLINIRHFAEMMERLARCLDGIDAATSHLEEAKAEMMAEYRREMASYMDWG